MIRTGMIAAAVLSAASMASAAITLSPKTSFSGDGWLSPAEAPILGSQGVGNADTTRSMAFNKATGRLAVLTRAGGPQVRLFDGSTGAELYTLAQGTGIISGGTFTMNTVGVADDGAVYAANLTTNAATSPYKIYRWADDNAATVPTVAFSGTPLAGARFGDNIDVRGSGATTQIAAGISNNPAIAGNNSYAVFSSSDGLTYSGVARTFTGTPPAAGDHRLGITFVDSNTMLGNQNATTLRLSDFDATTATLLGSPVLNPISTNSRAMDYAVIDGMPVLAILDTGSSGNADTGPGTLRVFDMSDPLNPVFLASVRAQTGNANLNGNATGSVAIGNIVGNSATIYTLVTNNGISAYNFTVPEPATLGLLAGAGLLALRRRK